PAGRSAALCAMGWWVMPIGRRRLIWDFGGTICMSRVIAACCIAVDIRDRADKIGIFELSGAMRGVVSLSPFRTQEPSPLDDPVSLIPAAVEQLDSRHSGQPEME
ncbi:hypothetical protein, partial [Thioalkalivibrio sp. ALJ12]